MLCKYAQNKTADRLSRHLSTVMRKIREVIGNSLASKRSLLHSSPQLAYGGELSSKTLKNKTLRNYLDIQWRTLHDSTRGKTISAVRPVRPCARPLRAAASSLPHLRSASVSRHVPGSNAPVRTTLRPLNDPSESPPSPSGNSGRAGFAQPAKLHRRNPSPTTVGQHCGNSGELCPYVYGSYGRCLS